MDLDPAVCDSIVKAFVDCGRDAGEGLYKAVQASAYADCGDKALAQAQGSAASRAADKSPLCKLLANVRKLVNQVYDTLKVQSSGKIIFWWFPHVFLPTSSVSLSFCVPPSSQFSFQGTNNACLYVRPTLSSSPHRPCHWFVAQLGAR